jgi:hydrogenase maturation protein HypF
MPYERSETTMSEFAFCATCEREYTLPESRRFHAQTNACADCGPHIWACDSAGNQCGTGEAAVSFAVAAIRAGRIAAIKGLGGYQLLVDAQNQSAVKRLRDRKLRRAKPLAVLVASVDAARRIAHIDQRERAALTSPANPIVVLRAKEGNSLAAGIHPGLDSVGVMLPTTPLHAMLARDFGGPLVCTSGNVDGDPLVYDERSAQTALADVADVWLHHDRKIARPIDDSVVRVIAGRPVSIRLARGLAPLPLELPLGNATMALGGHMKSAAAWNNGSQAVLGPHLGDLDTLASRERWLEQLAAWQTLYRFEPARLVHDLHPDYFTTAWAGEQPLPALAVQHHHAHVAAGMLEHGWLDREVLGVCWDGTGFGPDGTIWGGEFLVATARRYRRVARLRPFRLPGGEACVREPWRAALSVIADAIGPKQAEGAFRNIDAGPLLRLLRVNAVSPTTSSAGRLFDAAAQLALGVTCSEFEGQPAMMLEAAADSTETGGYAIRYTNGSPDELDWRPTVAALCADRRAGVAPGVMAMRFHRALANGIADVCRRHPHLPVVLGGGVFQNRLLTELVADALADHPQPIGLPEIIPPGDGGLAAGQLAAATMTWENA